VNRKRRSVPGAQPISVASHPECSVTGFTSGSDVVGGQSLRHAKDGEFSLAQSGETVRRARPDVFVPVLNQTLHGGALRFVFLEVLGCGSAFEPNQSCIIGPDPQIVFAVLENVPDPSALERSLRDVIDLRKANAIETDESCFRSKQQIAVMSLQNRSYGSVRQTLRGLPDTVNVLGQRTVGIESN